MNFSIVTKALVVWLGILVLAVANGLFREAILVPALNRPAGLILSGMLLSALILLVTYLLLPWFGRLPASRYFAIGLGWLCLTLTFEFAFGRLIQTKSWPELLEAYTFKDGNIWPTILFITAIAPYATAKIRDWI